MRMVLIPVVVLLVFPLLYLAGRLELGKRRAVRWIGGIALALAVLWSLPFEEGTDFLYVKRLNFFIAAGMALLALGRHYGLWGLTSPRRLSKILGVAALVTITVYTNFFSFHGNRTFIHLHDAAHYYLGSKYYAEVGYSELYTAMLAAEAEIYRHDQAPPGSQAARFTTDRARDLATYEVVDVRRLLVRAPEIKERFSPPRWREFQDDVKFFREALGRHYATMLSDHGFNATPVWTLFGNTLSNLVPGGSRAGLRVLCLLDLVLLAAVAAAIVWAFDRRTLLFALILFCLIYGANFGWTGGAFLRYLWFFGVVVGVCCLKKKRDAAAGALLAFATLLRIFPIFFAAPVVMKGLCLAWRHRRVPRRQAIFLGSFVTTAVLLVAATGLLPRGFAHWSDFRHQMDLHVANISPNVVGLTDALAYRPGRAEKVTQEEFNALKARRQRIHTAQLVMIFAPLVVLAWRLVRFSPQMGSVALALPLLHVSLSLGSYYQVFLVVLVLWQRRSMRNLALIFAVEAASYAFLLFEDRDGILFIYRSLLLLWLYLALFLPALRREAKALLG